MTKRVVVTLTDAEVATLAAKVTAGRVLTASEVRRVFMTTKVKDIEPGALNTLLDSIEAHNI